MSETTIRLNGVSYAAGSTTILSNVDIAFRPGCFNVLLGPNGAGKSTLMRIAAGRLAPSSGNVSYGDTPVAALDAEKLARRRAVLTQSVTLSFPLPVEDVVMMGRYPHYRAAPTPRDKEIVDEALALVEMSHKRLQPYPTLSGGERQKTHLARVLAQIWSDGDESEPRILFLDEPTTSLDIHYQIHFLETARGFLARNCTIVASLHDLNMAFDYGDRFYLLEAGRMIHESDGPVPKDLVERAYRVKVKAGAERGSYWRFRL